MNAIKRLTLLGVAVSVMATTPYVIAMERPSDETVTFWVKNALIADPYLDASAITVEVQDGIVTLSGRVRDMAAKQYADIEAKKIAGVLGVINEVAVMPVFRWDADIAQDVRHRIVDSAAIKSQVITVTCTDGVVKLTGTVHSWSERQEAGLLASEVIGVKRIKNDLLVEWEAYRSDATIKKDVLAALARDAYLVDMPIDASVTNGIVTLEGTVGSPYQKTLAYGDIRWIENVRGVENNLTVQWWERGGTRLVAPFPSDEDLNNAVTEELHSDSRLDPMDLKISVRHGHVIATGTVGSNYQKQIATADMRNIGGVTWVQNELTVRSLRRNDAKIRTEILSDFSSDQALADQSITVRVKNGVVTLSGKVKSGYDKPHAKMLASRVRGVAEVVDKLKMNWDQERDDATVFKNIVDRLKSDWLLGPAPSRYVVEVHNGVATLTGTVDNWGQRRELEEVVLRTDGVRAVDNQLRVKGYDYPVEDWHSAVGEHPTYPHEADPYGL